MLNNGIADSDGTHEVKKGRVREVIPVQPRVSVLMPVYNGEKYLREAVDSILAQTLTDFEFIIIDDGSADGSADIVKSYDDPRIHFIRNSSNLGLVATLNKGIDVASGEYLARMDQDDVSLPERLAKQLAFMESAPDVAASGTWARDIDNKGKIIGRRPHVPVGEHMLDDLWRPSPLIHPSAMIRVAHLGELRYDPKVLYAEDFDLWLSLSKKYKLDNLAEYLLLYRVHDESMSKMNPNGQARSAYETLCRQTGLEISYEGFVELVNPSLKLDPIRRARLTRRLAKALRRPYRRYFNDDFEYAQLWIRSECDRMKSRLLQSLYYVYCQIKISRGQ